MNKKQKDAVDDLTVLLNTLYPKQMIYGLPVRNLGSKFLGSKGEELKYGRNINKSCEVAIKISKYKVGREG